MLRRFSANILTFVPNPRDYGQRCVVSNQPPPPPQSQRVPKPLPLASHGKRRLFAPRSQGGGCLREEEWDEGVLSSAKDIEGQDGVWLDA